jgi:predicted dehydrogenase
VKEVRLGIIGVGSMGTTHAKAAMQGDIKRCRLAAVCDVDPKKMEPYAAEKFSDSAQLIRSGLVDAVTIATPHYFHTTIGIDALQNGLHVLTEKPLSVHKKDGERLIAAHTDKSKVFAIMFMFRTETPWLKIRQLLQEGQLGKLQRIHWTNTDWFRPDSYFASGAWRGTWAGEGGGVLTNQCPHHLDIWQWLFGMPSKVRAFCGFGKYHAIDVEDEVTAYMEYPDGCTGTFITGTGEAPGTNRMEIVGTLGRLVLQDRKLHFTRNEMPAPDLARSSQDYYGAPPVWEAEIPVPFAGGTHNGITQNFVDAILDGTPLVAPAAEGIRAVELANAMVYSALTEQTVSLPMDADAYEKKLKELIAATERARP